MKREIKGIDMVRRDWCPISKQMSSSVLDTLLNHTILSREETVHRIHSDLRAFGESIQEQARPAASRSLPASALNAIGQCLATLSRR